MGSDESSDLGYRAIRLNHGRGYNRLRLVAMAVALVFGLWQLSQAFETQCPCACKVLGQWSLDAPIPAIANLSVEGPVDMYWTEQIQRCGAGEKYDTVQFYETAGRCVNWNTTKCMNDYMSGALKKKGYEPCKEN